MAEEKVKASFVIDFRDLLDQRREAEETVAKPIENRLEKLRQKIKETRRMALELEGESGNILGRAGTKFGKRGVKFAAGEAVGFLTGQFFPNAGNSGLSGVVRNVAQDAASNAAFGGSINPATVIISIVRQLYNAQQEYREQVRAQQQELRDYKTQQDEENRQINERVRQLNLLLSKKDDEQKKRIEDETEELAYQTFQYVR